MSVLRRALLGGEKRTMTLGELDSWLDQSFGGGSVTETGLYVDPASAMKSAVVFSCVNVLAQTIAALPLMVYRRLPDGGKERAPEHRLYRILHDQPNPEMTAYEFRACIVGHVCLWGNGYCEIERSDAGVNALWPLRPDRMTPNRDDSGDLVYDYRLPDGTLKRFAFEQIMHWRGLSSNGIVGYSPIRQAAESIGLDMATRSAGNKFFGNDSRPGGILRHPGKLSQQSADRLKTSWESAHGGLSQKHRVAVLEEGIEWQQIGIPPEEAQFLETRRYGRSEIAALYRVPLHMINDLERATFANIEHQSLEFVKFTLMPWLVQIEQAVKRDLFGISDGKRSHFAEHLVDGLLRGDIASRYQAYSVGRNWGWLSANDVREFENMNRLPGDEGDMYLVPSNMMDASTVGEMPEPVAPAPVANAESDDDETDEDDSDTRAWRLLVRAIQQTKTRTVLVVGPPLAGKSTWVEKHAKPGDVVYDFDKVHEAISLRASHDHDETIKPYVFEARNAIFAKLAKPGVARAWIISTSPKLARVEEQIKAMDALVYPMLVTQAEAHRRADDANRPAAWHEYIDNWFKRNDWTTGNFAERLYVPEGETI